MARREKAGTLTAVNEDCLFKKVGADKACPSSGLLPLVVFSVQQKYCPVSKPAPSRSQTEESRAFTMHTCIHFAHFTDHGQISKQCYFTGGKAISQSSF